MRVKRPFDNIITKSPEFTFNSDDIARLRREMQLLVSNLSGFFIEQKELEQKELEKKARRKKQGKYAHILRSTKSCGT